MLKTVYTGGINHVDGTAVVFVAPTLDDFVSDINMWFFEYFHAANKEIVVLPPLDDWQRSDEDITHWSIVFPYDGWTVWVRREDMSFK